VIFSIKDEECTGPREALFCLAIVGTDGQVLPRVQRYNTNTKQATDITGVVTTAKGHFFVTPPLHVDAAGGYDHLSQLKKELPKKEYRNILVPVDVRTRFGDPQNHQHELTVRCSVHLTSEGHPHPVVAYVMGDVTANKVGYAINNARKKVFTEGCSFLLPRDVLNDDKSYLKIELLRRLPESDHWRVMLDN
jgi:hypothetical protein